MPISPEAEGALNGAGGEQPQQQSKAPANPMGIESALTDWLRGAYMIAALAPEGIREGITQAQQSFAGMVSNATAKKRYEALAARRSWEKFSQGFLSENRERLNEYGQIWQNDKIGMDEKMMALREAAMKRNDTNVSSLTASPEHFTTFGQFFDQQSGQQKQAEQATSFLDGQIKQIEAKLKPMDGGSVPPIEPYMKNGWDDFGPPETMQ